MVAKSISKIYTNIHKPTDYSSVSCRVRSVRLSTDLLVVDGAIPASAGRLFVFVGFRHPVIILQVSFSVASSFFAWMERSHTRQA